MKTRLPWASCAALVAVARRRWSRRALVPDLEGGCDLRLCRGVARHDRAAVARGPAARCRRPGRQPELAGDRRGAAQSSHIAGPSKGLDRARPIEQWLHADHDVRDKQHELVRALRHCDGTNVQCMIMVRDDFAMAAARFMRRLEIRLIESDNFATVDPFDLVHARKVLREFGLAYDRSAGGRCRGF